MKITEQFREINRTVALSGMILLLMVVAGVSGVFLGFNWGLSVLRGVTQPDSRPTARFVDPNKPQTLGAESAFLLRERDVLKRVQDRINQLKKAEQQAKSGDAKGQNKAAVTAKGQKNSKATALLLSSTDGGVTLEVQSVYVEGKNLHLNVSLRNEGSKPVRFLYSFLNLTDDQGKTLNTSTDGLPQEIPPSTDKTFSGVVKVPTALLEKSQSLSLYLTDYPDQRLQLQVSGIPVVQ